MKKVAGISAAASALACHTQVARGTVIEGQAQAVRRPGLIVTHEGCQPSDIQCRSSFRDHGFHRIHQFGNGDGQRSQVVEEEDRG